MDDSVERIKIAPMEELNAILKAWAPRLLTDVVVEKRWAMRLRILAATDSQCSKAVGAVYHTCTRASGHSGPCAHTNAATGVDAIGWAPTGLEAVLNVQPYHEEAL